MTTTHRRQGREPRAGSLASRLRPSLLLALAGLVGVLLVGPAPAAAEPAFPEVIDVPSGFAPEGVAIGTGTEFFTGSFLTGQIYKGDLRTGDADYLNDPDDFGDARNALGMAYDRRSDALFVAGGATGQGYLYDAATGDTLEVLQLTTTNEPTFVNDVVLTRTAAFFSDSFRPYIYRVALSGLGLPTGLVESLPLTGDYVELGGPGEFFNGNGIEATADGSTLLLVNLITGLLYTIDPATGEAAEVDLGGDSMLFGDGLVLIGKRLYAVQNFENRIGVWKLSADLRSATRLRDLTSPDFDVPATAAAFGNRLYAVNGRFDDWLVSGGDPRTLDFQIVQVRR